MFNSKKIIYIAISTVFLLCETVLGIFMHTASGRWINASQFLAVILACLVCIVFIKRTKDYLFTQIALIFTVFADYFLVWVSPQLKTWGMVFFLFAQTSYAIKLYVCEENQRLKSAHIISRVILTSLILVVTGIVLGKNTDILSLVSMAYYSNLVLNLVFAFCRFKKHYLLAIGFVFFLLCDTMIGLSMFESYFALENTSLLYKILYPGINLAWVFYLPSQMLLAISLLPQKFKKINTK